MANEIKLKLSVEEAKKRANELLANENVQLLMRVQDGQEKMQEYNLLVEEINKLEDSGNTKNNPDKAEN